MALYVSVPERWERKSNSTSGLLHLFLGQRIRRTEGLHDLINDAVLGLILHNGTLGNPAIGARPPLMARILPLAAPFISGPGSTRLVS